MLALAACGSQARPKTLNTAAVERAIAASIRAEHGLQTAVTCPASVPRKAGTSFTCTANLEVGSYPVMVHETNDQGHVIYANSAPLIALDVAKVEAAIV
jgi:hypothetical protein